MHLVDQWKNGSLVLSGLIYCWFALPVPINGTTKPVLEACVGQEWFVGLGIYQASSRETSLALVNHN
jgi:hypothetical protein